MSIDDRQLRSIARIASIAYVLLFGVAGIVLALIATLALFRSSLAKLATTANAPLVAVFVVLASILAPAVALLGHGIAVFVLYRFSAEGVLDWLRPHVARGGIVARISDGVHKVAAWLGTPDPL